MGVEGKCDVEHEAQGLLSCTNRLKRCLDIPLSERAEEEDGEQQNRPYVCEGFISAQYNQIKARCGRGSECVCVCDPLWICPRRFVNALIFPWNTNAELAMV